MKPEAARAAPAPERAPPGASGHGPYGRRLTALRGSLADEELDGLLVSHPANIRYLSGFSGSNGLLLVRDPSVVLVTDSRYREQAEEETPPPVSVRSASDGLLSGLTEILEGGSARARLGFEADRVTVRRARELEERLQEIGWSGTSGLVEELRERKDAGERARIRRAAKVACDALANTLPVIEEGQSEREIVAELEYRLRLRGSGPPPFQSIVASGPRSSLPHARPGERRLREGDLLLFDTGATVEGYCSDLTRTVVLGSASRWQREVHAAVLAARNAAVALLAPGRATREVDRAAREALRETGWDDHFGHSTGHGIGLEVHERPRLHRDSEQTLREGNVVTIEPGVYLPGRGGIRVEDDVLVEEGGGRVLTDHPRGLVEL